jgi:hypothetical protein
MADINVHPENRTEEYNAAVLLLDENCSFQLKNTTFYRRITTDQSLYNAFDLWHKTIWALNPANANKKPSWNSIKKSEVWESFEQIAERANGTPWVNCLVCDVYLAHPCQHGPSSLKKHVERNISHCEALKRMENRSKTPIRRKDQNVALMLAAQGKHSVRVSASKFI